MHIVGYNCAVHQTLQEGSIPIMKVKGKTELLWHILFADVMFLSLRLGGTAVIDIAIHAFFLLIATGVLFTHRRFKNIPSTYYWVFVPALGVALLQLIPIPDALFPYLAPIKWRTAEAAVGLYPDITYSTQITLMPQLHALKLAVFALDAYLVALMLMAPSPSRNTVRVWLFGLSLVIGALATMEGKGLIDESSLLVYYMGTYGGLVNPNHFACMAVLVMVPLVAQILVLLRRAVRTYQKVKPVPIDSVVRKVFGAIALTGAAMMLFSGFRMAYTRSGVIDMVIALGTLGLVMLFTYRGRRKLVVWAAAVPIGLVALLLIPGPAAVEKFETRGLEEHNRLDYLAIGVDYLKEFPLLGTGLGSTESILNQVNPQKPYRKKNAREFHNDFLQTLLELGPIGLLCLLLFVFWFLKEILLRTKEKGFEGRAMGGALLGVLLMLCFHSSVSFPLRITSIRVLMLIMFVVFLKQEDAPRRLPRSYGFRFLPMPALAVAIILMILPKALTAYEAESYHEEKALRHGRFAKAAVIAANEELQDIFRHNPPIEYTQQRMPYIRALALQHMEGQIYSVRGLNILFMLDVINSRIQHPEYDADIYAQFKAKARVIGDLGANTNAQATAPWMFLYASFAPNLSEEDQKAFDTIRSEWHYRYYRHQIKHFPESKGDWIAPPEDE